MPVIDRLQIGRFISNPAKTAQGETVTAKEIALTYREGNLKAVGKI